MASNRLRVTELDFDTIKNNLKNYLQAQNQFQDYDFEGSGLNILLDILAYNTHYNAYYLNMVANESFLDTAILRDSVVSHAKTLGYIPQSTKASVAIVNMTLNSSSYTEDYLTLEKGFTFVSTFTDNRTYRFVLLDNVSVNNTSTSLGVKTFVFENLEIYEGAITKYSYTFDSASNPKCVFNLPDKNVDVSTLRVYVRENGTSTTTETYSLMSDILDVSGVSPVYFLQETRNALYQIYFGDGVIGKALNDGNVVTVEYLTTSGPTANKLINFVAGSSIQNFNSYDITTVNESAGGADRESVDAIKLNAALQYTTQNRLVTVKDYESYIKKNYPSINSLSVWGGEDEVPPVYGKVFISLNPKNGYYISEIEKQRIIDEIIRPKSIVAVQIEILDPEYLYLILYNRILYTKTKTTLSQNVLAQNIDTAIMTYVNTNLNKFDSTFVLSQVQSDIADVDPAIVGTQTSVVLEKRFIPTLNKYTDYTISFNTELYRGTLIDNLKTSSFKTYDKYGTERTVWFEEVPASFTGITKIDVLSAGYGYTSAPIVTITGDGSGATATSNIVNGKVVSIDVINRGINYSKANMTLSGGGGFGASGSVVIDSRYGNLRTYYEQDGIKVITNDNAGIIDYMNGIVTLKNINFISVDENDGNMRIRVKSESDIISSKRNMILTVDSNTKSIIDEMVSV